MTRQEIDGWEKLQHKLDSLHSSDSTIIALSEFNQTILLSMERNNQKMD